VCFEPGGKFNVKNTAVLFLTQNFLKEVFLSASKKKLNYATSEISKPVISRRYANSG